MGSRRRHPRRGGDRPDPAAIGQIKGGIAELPDAERAAIDKAVTIVRRGRSVSLGMPGPVRTAAPATATTTEATA